MEYYDVIIIGAGIAGCGLAYNLKRIGYKGSVLVLDKVGIGANGGHGIRSTFESTIKKYNLPYFQKYKGFKMYVYDKFQASIENEPVFSMHYEKICETLLRKSEVTFKEEMVLEIGKNILKTNIKEYSFNYLIDCSGPESILREKLNMSKASRWWVGRLASIKPEGVNGLDKKFIHYALGDNGYVEEINPHEKNITHGHWQFVEKPNFNNIIPPPKTMLKKHILKYKILEKYKGKIIGAPRLPIIYKNFAFLGDSLGTAPPSTVFGIKPALDSSEILAKAILKKNLKEYKQKWKRIFLSPYIKSVTGKMDLYNKSKIEKYLKKYPKHSTIFKTLFKYDTNEYFKIMKSPIYIPSFPRELTKIFPQRQILFRLYYFARLQLQYKFTEVYYKLK